MANNPNNLRDPKVSKSTSADTGGIGKWVGIVLGAILVILLLLWLFGAFAGDDTDTTDTGTVDPNADVVVTE